MKIIISNADGINDMLLSLSYFLGYSHSYKRIKISSKIKSD